MNEPLSPIFNQPPEWTAFNQFLAEFGDDNRLDAVSVMERITPILKAYDEATKPRRVVQRLGGKNSQDHAHYYVFCTGLAKRGSFAYRAVRTATYKSLNILDMDRLMADTEIFKARSLERRAAQLQALARNFDARLAKIMEKGLDYIKGKLANSARWVDDIHFLDDADPAVMQNLSSARSAIADEMIGAISDLIGENPAKEKYVRTRLLAGLEAFDQNREAANRTLLDAAKKELDPDILNILHENPSSITADHYRWLTRDKRPEKLVFRRALALACPIILLMDGYKDDIAYLENGKPTDVDHTLATLFRVWTHPEELAFLKTLREDTIGAENARHLMDIVDYIKFWRTAKLPLAERADWDRLSNLVVTSKEFAGVLNRKTDDVFNELAKDAFADPASINTNKQERAQQIRDIRILRDRIVTFGLVPKMIIEAQVRGFQLPVNHALYLASGSNLVSRDAVATMPRQLTVRANGRHQTHLIGALLAGTPIKDICAEAFSYGTHYGDYDEQLRNLIITNRLAEHGADYPWGALPIVDMSEDGYTMIPLHSQSDLLKNSLNAGDEAWRLAPLAITDGTHFVAMRRRGGITDATVIIHEPEDDDSDWRIKDVLLSHTGKKRNHLMQVAEAYIATPEFLDTVDLNAIRNARARLYDTLSSRASGSERLGLSSIRDIEERKYKLNILARHWPCPVAFEIDENGCMSTPFLDGFVGHILDGVAPLYQRHTIDPRNPSGRLHL